MVCPTHEAQRRFDHMEIVMERTPTLHGQTHSEMFDILSAPTVLTRRRHTNHSCTSS